MGKAKVRVVVVPINQDQGALDLSVWSEHGHQKTIKYQY